jgi:hypothetical protein
MLAVAPSKDSLEGSSYWRNWPAMIDEAIQGGQVKRTGMVKQALTRPNGLPTCMYSRSLDIFAADYAKTVMFVDDGVLCFTSRVETEERGWVGLLD